MQIVKNKTMTYLITLFLMLTISATAIFVSLPLSNAHDPPWTVPTSAYVTCAPGIVGVNQYTTIIVWLDRYSPTSGGDNGQVWDGFKLEITKPDGTKQIIGPWKCSSALASDFKTYIPDQVGTYTIVFSMPRQTIVSSLAIASSVNIGDYFEGSTSEPCYLTVQEKPIDNWPEPSLPTDYWTLPINAANRAWSPLASNWLKGTWLTYGWQTAGTGPKSAHVLWTAPMIASSPSGRGYPGGIADAQWPTLQNNINDYQTAWSAPIIMNGIIYYNAPTTAQSDKCGYYAVDLYTGQQLWHKNGTDNGLNNPITISTPGSNSYSYAQSYPTLTLGQLYHSLTVNGQGINSVLWMQSGTTWYMLDSTTGNLILTLKNVPSGTAATDQDGNLLLYSYNAVTGNLTCWNSTQALYPGSPTGTGKEVFRPSNGAVIDAVNDIAWVNASTTWGTTLDPLLKEALKVPHSGYSMNVTIPKGLLGSITILKDEKRVPKQIFGSAITTTYSTIGGSCTGDSIAIWLATINEHATAYSPWPTLSSTVNTNHGFTVTLDYSKNITVPIPGKNHTWSIAPIDYTSQVFYLKCQQTAQYWCYSLETGNPLWGPTVSTTPMGYYSSGGGQGIQGGVYDGVFIAANPYNFNGQIFAYDATTGAPLWNFNATAYYGYESAYGSKMPLSLIFVCDGMAYMDSTEHSPTNPLWRNSYLYCVNMTDGTLIWKLQQYTTGVVQSIADGYIVTNSQYDNLIYCIGKGPSGTTVSAPQTVPTLGSSVMITGAVTDQSPGAIAYANKYGLMNGVSAVSEESQEAWMEYLYEQQTKPTNIIGVKVKLETIDPNGNLVPIGTATTDPSGAFGYMFTPEVPGTYRVIATFEGSNSYGSSSAQTYVGVVEEGLTPTAQPIIAQPPTEMYFALSTIAIIAAIAVIGAIIILVLKKRP